MSASQVMHAIHLFVAILLYCFPLVAAFRLGLMGMEDTVLFMSQLAFQSVISLQSILLFPRYEHGTWHWRHDYLACSLIDFYESFMVLLCLIVGATIQLSMSIMLFVEPQFMLSLHGWAALCVGTVLILAPTMIVDRLAD
jgi:hypothetical protein